MKDKKKNLTEYEIYKRIRKTWNFSPVSRIVQDKTKYTRKEKHKKNWSESE